MATNYIKICHHNIRGLRPKLQELKLFLIEEKPDIICFNETFLKPSYKIKLDNYNIIRNDRIWGRNGGVMVAINKKIQFIEIKKI